MGAIGGGVGAYNEAQAGDDSDQPVCFVLRNPEDEIVGGVIRATHYGWLYVNLMWVKAELRGRGYGRRVSADRQKSQLSNIAGEPQVLLRVAAHLLELSPGHKGGQVKVATDLFNDRFFRRLSL